MTWDYGDEGRAFPVETGQTWVVGNHVFHCSDLMEARSFDRLLDTRMHEPAVLYCDPPWGQSLVNSFRTKAGLARATYRWEDLYRRIADIGHGKRLPVWVEGSVLGQRDGSKIPATIAGGAHSGYVPIKYYRKHPCGLYYSGPIPLADSLGQALYNLDDDYTPGVVMRYWGGGGLVVDPCAGRGQTSRQAESVGWSSVNNELNPKRLSAALVRMARLINAQPYLTGAGS